MARSDRDGVARYPIFHLHLPPRQVDLGAMPPEVLAVFEFRVTKYDPARRDGRGAYTRDEWTSVSDIGRAFAGAVLTEAEYRRIEDAYATVAVAFLREAEVRSVAVSGLENHAAVQLPLAEGSPLGLAEVGEAVRRVLREEFWCRLEGAGAFVHFGYDYYMYVGGCPPVPRRGGAGPAARPVRRAVRVAVRQANAGRTRRCTGKRRRLATSQPRSTRAGLSLLPEGELSAVQGRCPRILRRA